MDEQFPIDELELIVSSLKQFHANVEDPDGPETLAAAEVDQLFIRLVKIAEQFPESSPVIGKLVKGWIGLRTDERADEVLISVLPTIIRELEEGIAEPETLQFDRAKKERRAQRRSLERNRGLFDMGILNLEGQLAALPERGLLNRSRLRKKSMPTASKQD